MSVWRWSMAAYIVCILLLLLHHISAQVEVEVEQPTSDSTIIRDARPPKIEPRARASLVSQSDAYIARNQRQCFETRNLVSCIKYKASKLIWKLATNGLGFFPNEYERKFGDQGGVLRWLRVVQLGEPAEGDSLNVFSDAKSLEGDSELTRIFKFLKRAVETFGRNHALQVALPSDTGARILDDVDGRGHKKKKKLLILLPLIILIKIAHLKMTLVTLLLGVLGMNVLLVGGMGWLIHYLKFKTLCKIHPHLVQSHSHVYDSDPSDYSQFVGSSVSNSYYGHGGSSPHEINVNGFSKDWGTSKAYSGYNYLDTISKRLQ
ncbi:uncharacterized protein LOC115621968 [Scaptodrosophila lebanonensis]|uniref:Uncharacterized protein LOC115621968 n=1 Tax=Drosophila lebanonensis TaxID=7225 RepID=A0A6J2T8Q3_DROLE|nr:uncharacterized protein LOC115621968 [Scaptodrosophila lebanonensis]